MSGPPLCSPLKNSFQFLLVDDFFSLMFSASSLYPVCDAVQKWLLRPNTQIIPFFDNFLSFIH